YSLWVEEETAKEMIKSQYLTSIIEEINEDDPENLTTLVVASADQNSREFDKKIPFIEKKDISNQTIFIESKYNLFEYADGENSQKTIQNNNNRKQFISQSWETEEETKTYRGVAVNESINPQTIVAEKTSTEYKVKPRTYRGITY
ncbi:hypothetical protein, partial [Geminocystis sp. GBBB08]|uniref:hypothetical protein n=1 Tax=Geminocystis sp. GBBB08 TaxID=2604140 RepID=UPI0027E3A170